MVAAGAARVGVVVGGAVLERGHGRAEGRRARAGRRRGRRAVPGRAGAAPRLARRVSTHSITGVTNAYDPVSLRLVTHMLTREIIITLQEWLVAVLGVQTVSHAAAHPVRVGRAAAGRRGADGRGAGAGDVTRGVSRGGDVSRGGAGRARAADAGGAGGSTRATRSPALGESVAAGH